jgi:hypothetical protein
MFVLRKGLSNPAPESYLDYLRFKLRRIATGKSTGSGLPPAEVQKTTLSDDRQQPLWSSHCASFG